MAENLAEDQEDIWEADETWDICLLSEIEENQTNSIVTKYKNQNFTAQLRIY